MKDKQSLSHTVWDCKYHIVWTAILGEEYIILNLLSRNLNSAAKFDFRFIFLYHE